MKLKLLAGAALIGVFAAPGAFAAPADTGWYGAIDSGAHFMHALTVLGRGWELAVTWQDLEMRLPVAVFESIARPLEAGRTWR